MRFGTDMANWLLNRCVRSESSFNRHVLRLVYRTGVIAHRLGLHLVAHVHFHSGLSTATSIWRSRLLTRIHFHPLLGSNKNIYIWSLFDASTGCLFLRPVHATSSWFLQNVHAGVRVLGRLNMTVSIHHCCASVYFRNACLSLTWIIRTAGAPHMVVFGISWALSLEGHRVFKSVIHCSWPVYHGSNVENLCVICNLVLGHDEALLGILTVWFVFIQWTCRFLVAPLDINEANVGWLACRLLLSGHLSAGGWTKTVRLTMASLDSAHLADDRWVFAHASISILCSVSDDLWSKYLSAISIKITALRSTTTNTWKVLRPRRFSNIVLVYVFLWVVNPWQQRLVPLCLEMQVTLRIKKFKLILFRAQIQKSTFFKYLNSNCTYRWLVLIIDHLVFLTLLLRQLFGIVFINDHHRSVPYLCCWLIVVPNLTWSALLLVIEHRIFKTTSDSIHILCLLKDRVNLQELVASLTTLWYSATVGRSSIVSAESAFRIRTFWDINGSWGTASWKLFVIVVAWLFWLLNLSALNWLETYRCIWMTFQRLSIWESLMQSCGFGAALDILLRLLRIIVLGVEAHARIYIIVVEILVVGLILHVFTSGSFDRLYALLVLM